ncbi:hypothetical protein [Sphingomonas astaxanthinifaciens]|uniref:Uncharacterized protein n=1 Tax=Sphingomonas astaxanthinifaciens DSM 22298 TaxID=1123267 RepID=A0ABQ5Z890_9SPHN|nr:hypothetical protein [Sphingomonas astaxanthinifaciens]GLR47855.1 hypothetical protein GCM10007925_15680 [Sphingomonas astaxanthinifaciens DSM 22298]
MRISRHLGGEPQLGILVFLVCLPVLYALGTIFFWTGDGLVHAFERFLAGPANTPTLGFYISWIIQAAAQAIANKRHVARGGEVEAGGFSSDWLIFVAFGIFLSLAFTGGGAGTLASEGANTAAWVALGLVVVHAILIVLRPSDRLVRDRGDGRPAD